MELLWVWLYGLKFPISILCGVGIFACFINYLSVRSSGRGDADFLKTLHIGLGIALAWAIIYALPAPSYNQKIVYKDRVVEKPIVKEVKRISMIRTITKTIRYTQDSRFNYCMDLYDSNKSDHKDECADWSKNYMAPRVVVKEVPVKVYAGTKIQTVMYTRDARVRWCTQDRGGTIDDCLNFALKMEAPAQVLVRTVHDNYQQLFDKCNNTGDIPSSDSNGTAIRNERIRTCGELALKASR